MSEHVSDMCDGSCGQIPPAIRKRVLDDMDEVALTGRFVIGPITSTAGSASSSSASSASASSSTAKGASSSSSSSSSLPLVKSSSTLKRADSKTGGGAAGVSAANCVEFPGNNRIHLRVGLPVRMLKLDPEQARAWYDVVWCVACVQICVANQNGTCAVWWCVVCRTLDLRKLIIVDLVFPPDYWNSLKTAIKVKVGQGSDLTADLAQGFRLSWTLEKRITNSFLSALPPLPEKAYDLSAVRDVMDVTGASFKLAVKALIEKKGDVVCSAPPCDRIR